MARPRKNWPTPPVVPPAPLVLILGAIIEIRVSLVITVNQQGKGLFACSVARFLLFDH
jgi:hypothetical protein